MCTINQYNNQINTKYFILKKNKIKMALKRIVK